MPLVPDITVADAIKEIAVRLGFADQGTARSRSTTRILSFIRQAMQELSKEIDWADNFFEVRVPLIAGQDRYEYPEESANGQVISVAVEYERGQRYVLQGGIRTQEFLGRPDPENEDGFTLPVGDPEFWRIVDREIQIRPAPIDITRTVSLVFQLQRIVPTTVETGTILPFDPELIIQRCVVLGRRHYQLPGQTDAERDYAAYLMRVKGKQRAAVTFFVGGRKSHYVTRNKEVYPNDWNGRGQNAPYTPNWTPW